MEGVTLMMHNLGLENFGQRWTEKLTNFLFYENPGLLTALCYQRIGLGTRVHGTEVKSPFKDSIDLSRK